MQMISSYLNAMWYLLQTDFKIFKQTIFDKIIDLCIWITTMTGVTVYLMPAFGLAPSYGNFMIAGLAASAGMFEQWSAAINLVSDLEGNNITSFYLTLPIPPRLIFVRNIISYAFNSLVLTIIVLPVCKLVAWHHIDFSHLHLGKFFIIFMLTNIFYGTFGLWLASMVKSLTKIGSVWMRYVYPLWFLGCFQYSFKVLHNLFPLFAYINYCNPMTYAMEGTRAAILGQEGFLNFWLCASMMIFFTLLLSVWGIWNMKKRLDF
jgi:ABC-type multidrug transport system permease subunit